MRRLLVQGAEIEKQLLPKRPLPTGLPRTITVVAATGLGDSLMSGPAIQMLRASGLTVEVVSGWDVFPGFTRHQKSEQELITSSFDHPVLVLRAPPSVAGFLRWRAPVVAAPKEFPGPWDLGLVSGYEGAESWWHFEWAADFLSRWGVVAGMSYADSCQQYYQSLKEWGEVPKGFHGDVVVHLGGRTMGQKYYPHRHTVGELLVQWGRTRGYTVAVVGGGSDEIIQGAQDWRGRLSVRQLAGVLRDRVFLGHDSGPLQLAGRVGSQAFGWYGPSNFQRTQVDGGVLRPVNVAQAPTCAPCTSPRCFHSRPMACLEVPPDEVANKVLRLGGIGTGT